MPKDFKKNTLQNGEFTPLLPNKKNNKVEIKNELNFSTHALDKTEVTKRKKRGRPIKITDNRYKVSVPKKISPALNNKLNILQDFMVELQEETGRVTFEKIVDTLAESYIKHRLGISKEEHVRSEIDDHFKKIK